MAACHMKPLLQSGKNVASQIRAWLVHSAISLAAAVQSLRKEMSEVSVGRGQIYRTA